MNFGLILNTGFITNHISQLLKAEYFDHLALSSSLQTFAGHCLAFKRELKVDSLDFYFIFLLFSSPLCICHVGFFFFFNIFDFITFCMRNRKQGRARRKWHGSEHLQRERSGNLLVKGVLPRIWIVETARAFILPSILLVCLRFSLDGTSEDYRNVTPKYFTHTNAFHPSITLGKQEDTFTLHIWEPGCVLDCGMVITWAAIIGWGPGSF